MILYIGLFILWCSAFAAGRLSLSSRISGLERDLEDMKQRYMRACGRHPPVPINPRALGPNGEDGKP